MRSALQCCPLRKAVLAAHSAQPSPMSPTTVNVTGRTSDDPGAPMPSNRGTSSPAEEQHRGKTAEEGVPDQHQAGSRAPSSCRSSHTGDDPPSSERARSTASEKAPTSATTRARPGLHSTGDEEHRHEQFDHGDEEASDPLQRTRAGDSRRGPRASRRSGRTSHKQTKRTRRRGRRKVSAQQGWTWPASYLGCDSMATLGRTTIAEGSG